MPESKIFFVLLYGKEKRSLFQIRFKIMSLEYRLRRKLIGNHLGFTSASLIIHFPTYIMSSGEASQTQSEMFCNTKTKNGEEGNSIILSKRKQN